MAPVTFRPITTQIEAPDYTKAGSVFSAALKKVGQAAAGFRQGRINVAGDEFTNLVRGAGTQEELAQIDTETLKARGASAEELAQAESVLTGRQVEVFGQDLQADYFQNIEQNAAAIQGVLTDNPELADTVSLDEGGNVQFGEDPNDPARGAANKKRFLEKFQASGFSPIETSQQVAINIRKQITSFGGSEEQIQSAITASKTRRKERSALDEGQQLQVASMDKAIDGQTQIKIEQEDFAYQQRINNYGMNPEEAKNRLALSRDGLMIILSGEEWGEELGLSDFFTNTISQQSAGIDIKELVKKTLNDNLTLKPWMILQALHETLDTDKGSVNIDDGDFKDSLKRLHTNAAQQRMKKISTADLDSQMIKSALLQQAELQKGVALSKFKGELGITNVTRNAALFNASLQRMQQRVASTTITDTTSKKELPTLKVPNTDNFYTNEEDVIIDIKTVETDLKKIATKTLSEQRIEDSIITREKLLAITQARVVKQNTTEETLLEEEKRLFAAAKKGTFAARKAFADFQKKHR